MHNFLTSPWRDCTCFFCFHQQGEIREKEQKLDLIQNKVSELSKCYHSEDTPAKLQVFNNNKKIIIANPPKYKMTK